MKNNRKNRKKCLMKMRRFMRRHYDGKMPDINAVRRVLNHKLGAILVQRANVNAKDWSGGLVKRYDVNKTTRPLESFNETR